MFPLDAKICRPSNLMLKISDLFDRHGLRWSDIGWGPVDPDWPAISFAAGTTAWTQLKKLQDGDGVLAVCAGAFAEEQHKRRITGISVPHHFTAPTRDIVHPDLLRETEAKYGVGRWPDSIACRAVYRILDPPSIERVFPETRLVTGTRGRYLADLSGVDGLFDRLCDLEIEELALYKSPRYLALESQPRQSGHRQAGWTSPVPKEIQGMLYEKVKSLFASAAASDGVYEYVRPERKTTMTRPRCSLCYWTSGRRKRAGVIIVGSCLKPSDLLRSASTGSITRIENTASTMSI
jgi:hypothetical protein